MASATPALSVRGQSPSTPEGRGIRGLRCHAECPKVADTVIEARVINRRGTLAEQDMVLTDGETRHPGVAEPAHRGETEQFPVEVLRLLQVIDGNRPVRDAFDVQETHRILLLFTAAHLTARAPPLARPTRGVPPGHRPATPGAR